MLYHFLANLKSNTGLGRFCPWVLEVWEGPLSYPQLGTSRGESSSRAELRKGSESRDGRVGNLPKSEILERLGKYQDVFLLSEFLQSQARFRRSPKLSDQLRSVVDSLSDPNKYLQVTE